MTIRYLKPTLLVVAILGLVIGLFVGGSNWKPLPDGLPDAGLIITWSVQISKLIFTSLGLIILGKLITITFLLKANDLAKSLKDISLLASTWAVIAIVVSVTQMAYVLGLNFERTFSPGVISTYLFDLTSSRGYLLSAVLALTIALLALFIRSENAQFFLVVLAAATIATPLLNSHSAALGDHSLALTSSIVHGLAVSAWVGTLFAVLPYISKGDKNLIEKFGVLAKWAVITLSISGLAAAYTRLNSISDFWNTGYGKLVVIKVLLFLLAIYFATSIRRNYLKNNSLKEFLIFESLFLALAVGFGVALQSTAFSRKYLPLPTAAEDILGFAFPPPPTVFNYIFGWHPEWVMLSGSVIALALYLKGVWRLRNSQITWPIGRTISFVIGILLLIWTSSGGIAKYAIVSFSAHMIQHMMLSMIAPIFLVLGAPITLVLRALPTHSDYSQRNMRDWVLSLLNSWFGKITSHPIAVLIIFTFGLYGLYFTPLFSALMRSHTGHVFMGIHFLLSGFLFAFMTVGIDPSPRKIPYWSKLMMVLVALGIHTFFAFAIMQSTTPIGQDWYSQVQPPWIFNPLKDTYVGGGIAWAVGEIPTLMLAILVAVQWARSDERMASQKDRAAQRDGNAQLNAYNERLAKLNKQD